MDNTVFPAIVFAALGSALASFATAAAWRVCNGKSLGFSERSVCESCGKILSPNELVPIFSYIFLKGKCSGCGTKISSRHLVTELIGAAAGVLAALRFGESPAHVLLCAVLLTVLIFCSVTDIESGYLYDSCEIFLFIFALAVRFFFGGFRCAADGAVGAAAGFVIICAIILLSRGGMGLGDAVLMLGIGAALGAKLTLVSLYFGFLIGGLYAVPLLITKKATRKTAVPLAPFLSLGAFFAVFAGTKLLEYFGVGGTFF